MSKLITSRRGLLKGTAALGAGLAAPTIFTSQAWAAGYRNEPTGAKVTLGFNVPQTGAYADEGADELRAYELAVEHINAGGGGMLDTFSSKALTGGINGKTVEFVTGDTQTKSDAARASAKRMVEKDGAIMITGGSSSGVAIAVQAPLPGSRRHLHGRPDPLERHHRQGQARQRLPSLLQHRNVRRGARSGAEERQFGTDRVAYHLTADYTWGWSQEGSIQKYTEAHGLGDRQAGRPHAARRR